MFSEARNRCAEALFRVDAWHARMQGVGFCTILGGSLFKKKRAMTVH
jgi:hypothetical protein